nr:uncharacterized protein LOC109407991 [Aedes albopictus]
MSDQDIKVQSFTDLRLIGDQLDRIPLRKVCRISLNNLRRQESDLEVYEFIFGQVVHRFDPDEFETEVSAVLLPEVQKHLDKILIELKDNALSCFLIDNLKSFLSFANILLSFAEYVYQVSEAYQLYRTATIFLEFLVRSYEIVKRSKTSVQHESNEQDIVQQIFTICQKIQVIMMHLLAPSEKAGSYFQYTDVEEQFSCLKDVIATFCKIGSLTMGLDNMRCTEAWKAVGKLCSLHEGAIKHNDTEWLHPLLFKTNSDIEASFKMLLTIKEFTKNDMVKLKLINLMLRVFIKLLQLINVDEYNEYPSILKTIVTIEDALKSRNTEEELTNAVRQYLLVGYMNVIGLIFRTKSFVKALTSTDYQSTEEITAFYKIIQLVILKVLAEKHSPSLIDLYVTDCGFLENCVGYISKSHRVFNQQPQIYRQLLVHLSAFVLMCSKNPPKQRQKLLEGTLVTMVLHESYWVGLMGLDIWSIYLRYHSVELLWQYLAFWKSVNDRFSSFASEAKVVFVRRLIHNMYLFLPNSMQQKLATEYPIMDEKNHRLWIAVGLQSVDKSVTKAIGESLVRRVKQNCSDLLGKCSVEKFYECLVMLHLSTCRDAHLLQGLESDVLMLWRRIRIDRRYKAKCDTLIQTLLLITTRLAEFQICSNALKIACFEKITEYFDLLSDSSRMKLIELMSFIPEKAEKILPLLTEDQNVLVKLTTLHYAANLKQFESSKINISISSALAKIHKKQQSLTHDFQQRPYDIVTPEHRCEKKYEAVQITQHISDRIDELFPDDEDDDFGFRMEQITRSAESLTESSPEAKRLKLNCSKSMTDIGKSDQKVRSTTFEEAIGGMRQQINILQRLHEQNMLSTNQLMEIRGIGKILAGFTEIIHGSET